MARPPRHRRAHSDPPATESWQAALASAHGRWLGVRFVLVFTCVVAAYLVMTASIRFQDPDGGRDRPVLARVLAAKDAVQAGVIRPYQQALATGAGSVLRLLGFRVQTHDRELRAEDRSFAVEITNGCDCVELTLLVVTAMLLFPTQWRWRWAGAALTVLVIGGLNFLRIISLWIIGSQWNPVFHVAHFSVWPFLLVLAAVALFAWWLGRAVRREVVA